MENKSKKKILVFIILAFLPMIAIGLFIRYGQLGVMDVYLFKLVSMFTPLLSVIITQLLFKEPVFKHMGVNFKFNRWWIIGWLLMPILSLAVLGTSLLAPGAYLESDAIDEMMKDAPITVGFWQCVGIILANGMITGATVNAVAAFGEEIGWRGFLVKELVGKKFIWAALFIGIVWGAWHFPLILNGHNYPDHPVIGVFMMMLMCACLTPIFLYFRLKGRSVIVPAILHGTFNGVIPLANVVVQPSNDLVIGLGGVAGILAMLLFDVAIFLYDRYISKENLFLKPLSCGTQPQ